MNQTNKFLNLLKNQRGVGLIWVYLTTAILGLSSASVCGLSLWESKLVTLDIERERAFYYAEAGVDEKLRELRQDNFNDIAEKLFGGGTYKVDYNQGNETITSTGTAANGSSRTLVVKVARLVPPAIRGAISGNGDLSSNGSVYIDGRDHDLDGNVIGAGTFGISTSGAYSQSGSSVVGGNGIAPADPAPPGTVEEFGSPMPATPEELFGFDPGFFDQYKTTEPPTLPMQGGIVYMTANGGSNIWNGADFGTEDNPSTGILIFHNEATDAELKNIHGYFNGIIITDRFVHLNGTAVVRGAVAVMDVNNNIGNGTAKILYSTTAIVESLTSLYSIVAWEDQLN